MSLELISKHPSAPAHATTLLLVHRALHAAWCWDEHFGLFRTPYEIDATARAYNTRAVMLSTIAHGMMFDRGWQRVSARMVAWLKQRVP